MSMFAKSSRHISKIRNVLSRNRSDDDMISKYTAIDTTSFVVLDTELTGLDGKRDRIVSIGAVKMTGKRIHTGDTMYELVKPSVELKHESIIIHGITPSELEEKPAIEKIMPAFIDFCGNDILVGFCPAIDIEFINKEMNRFYGTNLRNRVVDILTVYAWLAAKTPSTYITDPKTLYEIASSFEVPVKGAHNALADAFITAQIFQRLLHALVEIGVTDVDELCRISNPTKVGDALRLSTKLGNL